MKPITLLFCLLTLVLINFRANALEPTNMMIDFDSKSLSWLEVTRGGGGWDLRVVIYNKLKDS